MRQIRASSSGRETDRARQRDNTRTSTLRSDPDNLLFRYTDALYRAGSASEIYEAALDAICEGLGCARASILRIDDAGIMRFVAWRGLSEPYRTAVEGHSPWAPGARDAEPICIEDIALSDESDGIKSVLTREGIRGLAFIPITLNGAVTGKFMVYYDVPRLFTERERSLAVTIARQLGFAIERQIGEATARQLAAIVDSSEDPIISKTLDGTITSWNKAAELLFGYTAEEMLGRNVTVLFPPDRMEEEPSILARIAAGERVNSFETVRVCKDGRAIDVAITVSPLKDRDGRVIGASKIARDVTERRRAEERQALLLREMDHRVKNLFALTGSLVQLSARSAETPAELAKSVVDRLTALSRAHSLTMTEASAVVPATGSDRGLHALLSAILEPFQSDRTERIIVEGDDTELPNDMITPLALLLYELATNAVKHGGLSTADGRVAIRSRAKPECITLEWKELGGPSVDGPRAFDGFGGKLIMATARQLGKVEHHWEEDGLKVDILVSTP